jgi:hypothetical protein
MTAAATAMTASTNRADIVLRSITGHLTKLMLVGRAITRFGVTGSRNVLDANVSPFYKVSMDTKDLEAQGSISKTFQPWLCSFSMGSSDTLGQRRRRRRIVKSCRREIFLGAVLFLLLCSIMSCHGMRVLSNKPKHLAFRWVMKEMHSFSESTVTPPTPAPVVPTGNPSVAMPRG